MTSYNRIQISWKSFYAVSSSLWTRPFWKLPCLISCSVTVKPSLLSPGSPPSWPYPRTYHTAHGCCSAVWWFHCVASQSHSWPVHWCCTPWWSGAKIIDIRKSEWGSFLTYNALNLKKHVLESATSHKNISVRWGFWFWLKRSLSLSYAFVARYDGFFSSPSYCFYCKFCCFYLFYCAAHWSTLVVVNSAI